MNLYKKLSTANKIGVIVFITLTLVLAFFGVQLYKSTVNGFETRIQDKQLMVESGIINKLNQQFKMLAVGIEPIINNQQIIDAFEQKDRELLSNLTLPSMNGLRANGIRQFQFHLPNGISFYRVHQPETFGDDLSSFRHTVVQANQDKKVVQGLEGGVAGAGFRYVVPISNSRGVHIGTVELGMGLTGDFLKSLQQEYGGDFDFFAFDEAKALVHLNGVEDEVVKDNIALTNEQVNMLKNKQTIHKEDGKISYRIIPLQDFLGDTRWAMQYTEDNNVAYSEMNRMLIINLVVFIVMIIIVVVLLVMSIRKMLAPINTLTEVAEKIARNDLRYDEVVITNSPELSLLGKAFNTMGDNIHKLVTSLQEENKLLRNASLQLKEYSSNSINASEQTVQSIEQVASSAEDQLNSTDETAKAMEEMAIGIGRVAETSTHVAESSGDMMLKAKQGDASIKQSIESIITINDSVETTSIIIDELKHDSDQIGKIVKMISDISEQTNLLALNAAIEAARAGEAGRGFAVVADEIRKLADQTSQSTNQINEIINQIQAKTINAASSMTTSQSQVKRGIEVFESVGEIFTGILSSVESVAAQIEDLSAISEQMSAGSQQVSASVEELASRSKETTELSQDIVDMAKEQFRNMEEIVRSAEQLNEIAEDLQAYTEQFHT
jgi:methyl-accepting chemotaxis protein